MISVYSIFLTFEGVAMRNAHEIDYPESVFQERLIDFIKDFSDLLDTHLAWLPTAYRFFGGLHNVEEFEMLDDTHFRIKFLLDYEDGLSREFAEEICEQAKDYVKKLNAFFKLFGVDVEFKDDPEIEYVDDEKI